jgi:hypothetical protein
LACSLIRPKSPCFFRLENISDVLRTRLQQDDRIKAECGTVQQTPGISDRVRQSVVRRCKLCNEVGGRHFEQLLQLLMMKCLIIITMLCQCYLCTNKSPPLITYRIFSHVLKTHSCN